MKKNDSMTGGIAQRQQDTFYLNEDTPRPIQSIFIYGEKCCVSVISSTAPLENIVLEEEVGNPAFRLPAETRYNPIFASFMDFLDELED